MTSQRAYEGCLLLDHRDSPGIADAQLNALGLPAGIGHGLQEVPTFTCRHCTAVVVMNAQRTRPREYCRQCDSYICDRCGAIKAQTKQCVTWDQVVEEHLNRVSKGS